jgi:hypothetical protein
MLASAFNNRSALNEGSKRTGLIFASLIALSSCVNTRSVTDDEHGTRWLRTAAKSTIGLVGTAHRPLPRKFDASAYVPRFTEGDWFVRAVQSVAVRLDGQIAKLETALWPYLVSETGTNNRHVVNLVVPSGRESQPFSIRKRMEFMRVDVAAYALTRRDESQAHQISPVRPPELLLVDKQTTYERPGLNGRIARVEVDPVGVSDLVVARHLYANALNIRTCVTETASDGSLVRTDTHAWWVPQIGKVAELTVAGTGCYGGTGGCLVGTIILLKAGHEKDGSAAARAMESVLPRDLMDQNGIAAVLRELALGPMTATSDTGEPENPPRPPR